MQSVALLMRACQRCTACLLHHQPWRFLVTGISEVDLPRITVPHKMQSRLQKIRQRQRQDQPTIKKSVFKSPLVISCKRGNFNHHRGQTYNDFGPQALASYGWKSRKSAGDYFTVVCHDKNPALASEESAKRFEDLHLDESLVKAVHSMGLVVPTNIQKSGTPAILSGGSTLCAAETGSGKTLAYLLPVLTMLLQRRTLRGEEEAVNSPSVIILTPSRELADQIMRVVETLQQHVDFTAYSVCGGRGTKGRLAWPVRRPMDILVATPGVLRKLLIAGQIKPSGLQHIILDEADTLLDDSFMDSIDRVLSRLKIPTLDSGVSGGRVVSPGGLDTSDTGFIGGVQFVLVSATVPRALPDSIGAYLPVDALQQVTSPGLHRLMPHVPQKFMRLLPSQKSPELVKLVRSEVEKKAGSMMIFCNSSSTCFYLGHLLEEHSLPAALINGDMTEKSRQGVFERFQEGRHDILVATDIASRGLDTINVRHVVNYDFPNFVSDYLHRAGRVGRVGSHTSGLVTSFVTHKWEVDLLWQIEISVRKSADLHNVNANIKRKISAEYAKRHGTTLDAL
ncbi:probable ATP-dependent RNA helicase DDX28 [Littorina saxatilis]|uniref:RNA helicase n=1 Tax=Littorina saxatilis TaxID=31220 RepID=A0AAN9GDS0_9CAEN